MIAVGAAVGDSEAVVGESVITGAADVGAAVVGLRVILFVGKGVGNTGLLVGPAVAKITREEKERDAMRNHFK